MVGAPPESLIRLPKEMTAEASREIYGRLGLPGEAADYKLDLPDGENKFGDWFKGAAHKAGLPNDLANAMAQEILGHSAALDAENAENAQLKAREEETALRKEWGNAYEQNHTVAKNAAREFGVTEEQLDALEGVLGFKGVHEFFHNLGTKIGESSFKGGGGSGGFGNQMTPAAAQAALSELQMDQQWYAAFLDPSNPGHKEAVAKKTRLTAAAYPDPV
jgi:hypothetical protein